MAKSGKTPQEFIQYSFSPQIAVLSSPKVDNVVSKNNLSFVELLQPFTILDWDGQFREPTGSWCTVRNWKLNIRDVHWKPLQPTEARKQLNNAVILNYNDRTVSVEQGNHKIDIPQSTLWFDAWRETYFEVQFPSDHEYTKHFISCMLVATTQDDNIVDTYNSLLQQLTVLQNVTPPKLPKWFNTDVLKTYVLLHDSSTETKDKIHMFEMMQQTFGAHNCFMLTINSRTTREGDKEPLVADLWAPFIRRSETQNELLSPHSNFPQSPVETGYSSPSAVTPVATQEDFATVITSETQHPLTTNDNDLYDNANSLQNDSFSGSVESVSIDKRGLDVTTEVHGGLLSAADVDNLKQFLKDYAGKAMLPYFERQISLLSDVVANRKGVSRSLLSATKRWFGTGKGGTTTANNTVIYSNDCPELQLRRLGDLWFMCGQWQRAFDTYHTAKREFYADGAWLCYAGSLEMAAISAFMAGEASRKTYSYIEESITTYLNTCRMVQYAVRATLLSVLCLNTAGLYGEAAKQLIRMTSEDSDLRSAMLLEQAALSFLAGPGAKGMCRKYAFHMVLAGHRFSKAGQKKHAYRCYRQAHQVYAHGGWRLSSDHVQFALGRLASSLRSAREAARWLVGPLAPHSPQPPQQQYAFLREYMLAHQQWVETSEDRGALSVLPLPIVWGERTGVLCAGTPPLAAPRRQPASSLTLHDHPHQPSDRHWHRLELMLLQSAPGPTPMVFKPTVSLHTTHTDNSTNPTVPQGEPVQISIAVNNPLKIPLILMDVELLWQFHPEILDTEESEEPLLNEPSVAAGVHLKSNIISSQKIKTITLEGESEKNIIFSLTPLRVGQLHLKGLAYKLSNGFNEEFGNGTIISGKQILEISGKTRAHEEESQVKDKRLQIKVIPCSPCLQMTFSEVTPEVISGEIQTIDVEFRNVGPVEMRDLHIAFSHPECVTTGSGEDQEEHFHELYREKYQPLPVHLEERALRAGASRVRAARHVRAVRARLESGDAVRCVLHVRPLAAVPRLHLLAYYRSEDARTPHRLLRHTFQFNVLDTVKIVAIPRRYIKLTDEDIGLETMSLSVEIQNDTNVKDSKATLEVLEASLLSRQWKFTDFIISKNKDDALTLHEKMHLVLRANRISNVSPGESVEWSSLKINKKHPESLPNINNPPYSKFVVDYKSSIMDDVDTYNLEKRPTGLIQSTLVVRWKIQVYNRSAIGQSYIWLNCFSDAHPKDNGIKASIKNEISSLNFEESDSNDDLLSGNKSSLKKDIVVFRIEHSNNVNHSFKQRKLCVVPVVIHFVNCYGVPVKAFMNMSTKSEGSEVCWSGALSPGPEPTEWGGVSVALGPFESRRVSVQALVTAPGTYLIGAAAKLTCQLLHCNPVTQFCNNSSVLVVKEMIS